MLSIKSSMGAGSMCSILALRGNFHAGRGMTILTAVLILLLNKMCTPLMVLGKYWLSYRYGLIKNVITGN